MVESFPLRFVDNLYCVYFKIIHRFIKMLLKILLTNFHFFKYIRFFNKFITKFFFYYIKTVSYSKFVFLIDLTISSSLANFDKIAESAITY